MFLILRIVHIVTGVFWAGTVFFLVSYLMPSMAAAGPGAGPVQGELMKRKLFQRLPIIAMLAIISGFWMYYLRMQGTSGKPPRELMVLGVGGIAAVVAIIIGFTTVRPAQDRIAAMSPEANGMPAGPAKDAKLAEIAGLRKKLTMMSRIVASLLGVTVVAMAIARYV
jgi:uncharacterized membrane protein